MQNPPLPRDDEDRAVKTACLPLFICDRSRH
jgi:hypothetical protein